MEPRVIEPPKQKAPSNGPTSASSAIAQKVPQQLKQLEQRAEARLRSVASTVGALAKQHPAVTAGVLMGAGVVVGVAAQRALHREPTVGEAMMGALKRGTSKVSKRLATTVSAGLSAGRASARRALR